VKRAVLRMAKPHLLEVPEELRSRIASLELETREGYPVLRIIFKEVQKGLRGIPVRQDQLDKLLKLEFSVILIQRLSSEYHEAHTREEFAGPFYDETRFRLLVPASVKRRGVTRRETVSFHSEFCVLQYFQNNLEPLYALGELWEAGLLPLRDIDRARINTAVAQDLAIYGVTERVHQAEEAFSLERAWDHIQTLYVSLAQRRGEQTTEQGAKAFHAEGLVTGLQGDGGGAQAGDEGGEGFFHSREHELYAAIYAWPGIRCWQLIDPRAPRAMLMESFPVYDTDPAWRAQKIEKVLERRGFLPISWEEFHDATQGIRAPSAAKFRE